MIATDVERRFKAFITNRHKAYLAKAAGLPRHVWTHDPIIGKFRFCNVYRKLDRVTVWLDTWWLAPRKAHPDLWFQTVVGRLINEPDALAALRGTLPWNADAFMRVLLQRQAEGLKIRNTAYIVSTNGRAMPFVPYIVEHVLNPLWKARATMRTHEDTLLSSYAEALQSQMGIGTFLAGQIIADLKYYDANLLTATDWKTFVVPGPGSRRGMARLLGHLGKDDAVPSANDRHFFPGMRRASALANEVTFDNGWQFLDAQDVQNCLCEFDKHERALHGQGTPKQLYTEFHAS